jgi:hypothetical protein
MPRCEGLCKEQNIWLKSALIFLVFFLSQSLVQAVILDEGTIIKPNISSSGYYIVKNTIILESLEVNSTHAVLTNLNENNDHCRLLDTSLNPTGFTCVGSCILEQTEHVYYLDCTDEFPVTIPPETFDVGDLDKYMPLLLVIIFMGFIMTLILTFKRW